MTPPSEQVFSILDDLDQKYDIWPREPTPLKNKAMLLEIARNGEPRPTSRRHPLGQCLVTYTSKNNQSYDLHFNEEIRKLRPDWFDSSSAKNKAYILQMIENGEPKPTRLHPVVGVVYSQYISQGSGCFDESLFNQIKTRTDWLETPTQKNKKAIFEIASKGEPRPKATSRMGRLMHGYTVPNKDRPTLFDVQFLVELQNIRPDWFETKSEKIQKRLLEMAANGDPRPLCGHHDLGQRFVELINPNSKSYRPEFLKKISEQRPDWLEKSSDVNKRLLLQMARDGKPKPKLKDPLGGVYQGYVLTGSSAYDASFVEQIRSTRPEWLVNRNQSVQRKEKLMAMAKNGEARPTQKTNSSLAYALLHYTGKRSKSYDAYFHNEISKLRTDWFKK